jgi:hypothetical protein
MDAILRHIPDELLLHNILWTDEPCFMREGVFNVHNGHLCASDNPNIIRKSGYQVRLSVNIWVGKFGGIVVCP